ncbi:Polyamine transporter-like protein 5 [Elsinoe fawcettii]|nr:Polyamine transporter-like protein 5 [Elsinoe fawcettii]
MSDRQNSMSNQSEASDAVEKDVGLQQQESSEWNWDNDRHNPRLWPKWKKNMTLIACAILGFTCSVGTSIVSPAVGQFVQIFDVSRTVAFLPLSLYVLALGLGPVVGGPLSEVAGRQAVQILAVVLGGLFSLGSGLTNSFAGLCIMRFLAGFFTGPTLAIGSGILAEVYAPIERGLPSTLFVLSPFLGPALGPVLGVFLVEYKDWRWTQYTLVFFSAFSLFWIWYPGETYHPVLIRRRRKQLGLTNPPKPSFAKTSNQFLVVGLIRPIRMLFTEPIVAFTCLYVAFVFGTLFMFFGAFFYVFQVYGFTQIQKGLVFLAIGLGCVFGTITLILSDRLLYRPKALHLPPGQSCPELRLYPALIGSIGVPVSLFWFAWTARADVNAAVPIIAIVLFGWSNIIVFVSCVQYLGDCYHSSVVASASAANSLARYGLAAAFPLFSLTAFENLGTAWATSMLGFISVALLPGPWIIYRFGPRIRARSKYDTA